MLSNFVNFGFSTMKKLLDLVHLFKILDGQGIGINIHECKPNHGLKRSPWPNPRNVHLCTK